MKWNYIFVRGTSWMAPVPPPSLARRLGTAAALGLALSAILLGRPARGADLYPSTIYSTTQAVAAITCGDFDPQHAGSELVCLMADSSIVELALGSSGWNASTIFVYPGHAPVWEGPSSRVSLRVGHVLTNAPGQQLVVSYWEQIYAVLLRPRQRLDQPAYRRLLGHGRHLLGRSRGRL